MGKGEEIKEGERRKDGGRVRDREVDMREREREGECTVGEEEGGETAGQGGSSMDGEGKSREKNQRVGEGQADNGGHIWGW